MRHTWKLLAVLLLIPIVTAGCSWDTIGRFRIEGMAMSPALVDGNYIFTDNEAYVDQNPRRGDIVVFARKSGTYIKRVIGLPGETIEVRRGQVLLNGIALDEPYVTDPAQVDMPSRKIEPDRYFVMGDNRNNSSDSRAFGTISIDDIIGRTTFIYAPADRAQFIPRPKYPEIH